MEKTNSLKFDYSLAFSRNLGWLSELDQKELASKRVAIAGLGGVGGHYAEVLARLGITKFNLADFDTFEIQNFNRQNASGVSSITEKKCEQMIKRVLDINPEAEIRSFHEGINDLNMDEFLHDVDLYLDGLDFFVMDIRRKVFKAAHAKKIVAITIAPVGMGASLVVFNKDSLSFEDHFGIQDSDSLESASVKFLVGLTPSLKQVRYLVDRTKSDFKSKKAPSLAMGPYLCAGIAGSEAVKVLLQKKKAPRTSPWVLHFDAYLQSYHKNYIWMGHKNLLQKIKCFLILRMLRKTKK